MNVGKAIISPLETMGETSMIKPECVQDRCLKIVDMDLFLHRSKAEFVGSSVADARFHATTGHEQRVAIGIMVTSEHLAFCCPTFAEGSAPKLAAPDNQCFIKHAALLKIPD